MLYVKNIKKKNGGVIYSLFWRLGNQMIFRKMARQHGTAEYSARFIFRHFLLYIVVVVAHTYRVRTGFCFLSGLVETSEYIFIHNLCNQITHVHNKLIKHAKNDIQYIARAIFCSFLTSHLLRRIYIAFLL